MDRETVITHLQIIHTWAEFARERDLQFFTAKHLEDIAQWAADALALLKEQEEQIKNRDESLEKAREEIKWLRGMLKEQEAVVRCMYCKRRGTYDCPVYVGGDGMHSEPDDWFCADGERMEGR